MTSRDDLGRWVERYVEAWSSNDPEDIRALFTEDARYYPEPHVDPWTGHGEIVSEWLARRDEPEEYTFRWEILATDGDLGFVRGWTGYPTHDPPKRYGNLWVIRLANDGRATEYTEWYVRIRDATPPLPE